MTRRSLLCLTDGLFELGSNLIAATFAERFDRRVESTQWLSRDDDVVLVGERAALWMDETDAPVVASVDDDVLAGTNMAEQVELLLAALLLETVSILLGQWGRWRIWVRRVRDLNLRSPAQERARRMMKPSRPERGRDRQPEQTARGPY